jgi:hypothetical protein
VRLIYRWLQGRAVAGLGDLETTSVTELIYHRRRLKERPKPSRDTSQRKQQEDQGGQILEGRTPQSRVAWKGHSFIATEHLLCG